LWFPYNISATAGANDFKYSAQLGSFKAYFKIIRRRRDGHGPGLGELAKIWMFLFYIYTMAEARTSNLVHSLGLPTPTIKPHPEEKWAWPWFREAPIHLVFPFNISATASLSS